MKKIEIKTFEQDRIGELVNRLTEQEKSTKGDRSRLWQSEKGSKEQYTVLDRLDVLSMFIVGYASQIASKGYTLQEPDEVISHLHRLSIFNVECVVNWYPTSGIEYPSIKQYFELLDYVRLLALDYVQQYRLQELAVKSDVLPALP